ncbi:hypothetical protein [Flexivirga sp. B27]
MTATPFMSRLHGPTAANVPRWAIGAAYAIHLAVLPSCIWRILGFTFNVPLAERSPGGGSLPDSWGPLYVIVLSLVTEAFAFLAFGLVCRWGEVFPGWIPGLRGRRVPISAAVVPAAIGTLILLIYGVALCIHIVTGGLGTETDGNGTQMYVHAWQTVLAGVAYFPLVAWGPLLGLLTVRYYRRRSLA